MRLLSFVALATTALLPAACTPLDCSNTLADCTVPVRISILMPEEALDAERWTLELRTEDDHASVVCEQPALASTDCEIVLSNGFLSWTDDGLLLMTWDDSYPDRPSVQIPSQFAELTIQSSSGETRTRRWDFDPELPAADQCVHCRQFRELLELEDLPIE